MRKQMTSYLEQLLSFYTAFFLHVYHAYPLPVLSKKQKALPFFLFQTMPPAIRDPSCLLFFIRHAVRCDAFFSFYVFHCLFHIHSGKDKHDQDLKYQWEPQVHKGEHP